MSNGVEDNWAIDGGEAEQISKTQWIKKRNSSEYGKQAAAVKACKQW